MTPTMHTHARGLARAVASSRNAQSPAASMSLRPPRDGNAQERAAATISSSPRLAAQTKQLEAAFGNALQRKAVPESVDILRGGVISLLRNRDPQAQQQLRAKVDSARLTGAKERLPQGRFPRSNGGVQLQTSDRDVNGQTGLPQTPMQLAVAQFEYVLGELDTLHLDYLMQDVDKWGRRFHKVKHLHPETFEKIRKVYQELKGIKASGKTDSRQHLTNLTFQVAHIELDIEESSMEEDERRESRVLGAVSDLLEAVRGAIGKYPKYSAKEKPERAGCVKFGPEYRVEKDLAAQVYARIQSREGTAFEGYFIHVVRKVGFKSYNVTLHRKYKAANPKTEVNMHVGAE